MTKAPSISLSSTARALISVACALAPIPSAFLVHAVIVRKQFPAIVQNEVYGRFGEWIALPLFGRRLIINAALAEIQLILLSILCGFFLAAYVSYPLLPAILSSWRPYWRKAHTAAALALTGAGFAAFILHCGNRQWGGYDASYIVDAGWRLVQGQVPYRDFIVVLPPGFYLGVKYAFQLFGVRWQAVVLVTAIFAPATFLWIYFLLAEVLESRLWAYSGATAIECGAMLTICYWWYNPVTAITAAIFFLSCLLYLKKPNAFWPQASYVASLAIFGLMKPNVAFLLAAGCILCALIVVSSRARLLILSFLAIGVNLTFLALNHVSPSGMIASYLGVAGSRGVTIIGLEMMETPEVVRLVLCLSVLALPFLVWWPRFLDAARKAAAAIQAQSASRFAVRNSAPGKADYRGLAYSLLLLGGPAASLYAMCTNAELKDVDCSLLLCFGLVLFVAERTSDRARLARVYLCFVLASVPCDLYLGVVRYRVRMIQDFFSAKEEVPLPPGVPFFGDMLAGQAIHDVVQEVQEILPVCPRPVFFGPRMEFAYAAFRLPSPPHMPLAWWYPGTTFGENDEPIVLKDWSDQCFETLIFSKHDFLDYSRKFLLMIQSSYDLDDGWDRITVLRRRGTAVCTAPGTNPR